MDQFSKRVDNVKNELVERSDAPSPKKSVPVRFRVSEVGSGSVPGITHWEPGICLREPGTRRFPHNSKLRIIKNHYQAVKKRSGNNLIIRTKCSYNEWNS